MHFTRILRFCVEYNSKREILNEKNTVSRVVTESKITGVILSEASAKSKDLVFGYFGFAQYNECILVKNIILMFFTVKILF